VPGRQRGKASLARIARFGDSKIESGVATRAYDYNLLSPGRDVASDYHLRPFRDRGVVCQGTRIPGCSRHSGALPPV